MDIQRERPLSTTLTEKELGSGRALLSKSYSKELQKAFEIYELAYTTYNALIKTRITSLPFTRATSSVIVNIDRAMEIAKTTITQDKFDAILLEEIIERLEIMKVRLEYSRAKTFSYDSVLRTYGITHDDIKTLEKRFKNIDYETLSDNLLVANGQSYDERPVGLEEVKMTKELFLKLLKITFELSPQTIKSEILDFNTYLKNSVQMVELDGRSYQSSGRIYLNVNDAEFIYVRPVDGCRYKQFLDPFSSSGLVGEEGLLGHQGQFLITEKAEIPVFLKNGQKYITMINAETLGDMGRYNLIRHLKADDFAPQLCFEDFNFLKQRFETWQTAKIITKFFRGYESYIYFTNNKDENLTAKMMYSITKSEGYLSEEYIKRVKIYYESIAFWGSYNDNIEVWGYLIATLIREKIDEKIDKLNFESAERIREQLSIGWWTRKGFEKYVDYLIETLGRS